MKTIKYEIKLERSVKIILGIFAVGVFLNALSLIDIITPLEAKHDPASIGNMSRGLGSYHITIDNWPQGLK
jgi:hypothetical protein